MLQASINQFERILNMARICRIIGQYSLKKPLVSTDVLVQTSLSYDIYIILYCLLKYVKDICLILHIKEMGNRLKNYLRS